MATEVPVVYAAELQWCRPNSKLESEIQYDKPNTVGVQQIIYALLHLCR